MNSLEFVRVALESIRGHKLRSFLTTLGIVIGIAAVITVMAVGQGGRAMLVSEMEKLGSNLFVIYVNYNDGSEWRPWDITEADVRMLKQAIPEISYVAPVSYNSMKIRGSYGEDGYRIYGTSESFAMVRKLQLQRGRFFTDQENKSGRRVAVLDNQAATKLFKNEEAVGQTVLIEGNPVLVIGVLKKEESSMINFESDSIVYLPRSVLSEITGWDSISELECSAVSKDQVTVALQRAQRLMERRHNAPGHYAGFSMEKEMQSANRITGIMTLIIGAIAAISLIVGGIGVMNIMLVSVSERTREIGIRMALGAKRRDILIQFLIEAVVLCFIGGIIGISLGYGGAYIIAKIAKWPPLVSWGTVALACGFSALVGVIFGLLPANQASRLDPIEALRRD
ncbi:MAG: ABC transporter permease [Methylocystaceae bacterium]